MVRQETAEDGEHHINIHSNARLLPRSRADMVKAVGEGLTLKQPAACFNVSWRTVAKWMARYRKEGVAGLQDRSSRPANSPRQTSNAQVAVVLELRRMRLPGFKIARQSGLSKAAVSRILAHHGLSKLSAWEPAKPIVRYQPTALPDHALIYIGSAPGEGWKARL